MKESDDGAMSEVAEDQARPAAKRGKRFWILVTAGSLVIAGAVAMFFVAAQPPRKDHAPALTAEELEQQKYDAEQIKQERQKTERIRDDNFLVRKEDDSQAELESLLKDLNLQKDSGSDHSTPLADRQATTEEEAIAHILRDPTQAAPNPGPFQSSSSVPSPQTSTSADSDTRPMFVYSRTFAGAKFVDAPKPAVQPMRNSTPAPAEAVAPEPLKSDQTVTQDREQKTTLIYTNLPPVTLFEGETIEGVLVNRIVADTEPSPVICHVARDLFDHTAQYVIFPANSRIVGLSQVVNYKGARRLFISFHRIILPNGPAIDLPSSRKALRALDETGALGVASKVERHWFLQFGTALFFGALDGLSGASQRNRDIFSTTSIVLGRTSENFQRTLENIMSQYSTIVPTIRVDQGKRILIYLSDDVVISPYAKISDRSYYAKR